MSNWKIENIGKFAAIGRGSSPRPITDKRFFENGTIPWIKIADATAAGRIIYKTKEYVNEYGASFSRLLKKGSLILSASGVSLGIPRFLGVDGCIHDGWLYLENIHDIDVDFLYYKLLTLRTYFDNLSYGAAIQNINTDIFSKTKISLPPLPIQQKIASILSAYDNLIQNYKKQIEALQTAASELYKEWFVRFRFPGYQTNQFENGIPAGWNIMRLNSVATLVNGRAYLMPELLSEGKYRIVRVGNFSGKDEWFYSNMELEEDKYCQKGDLLYKWACNFGPEIWNEEKVIYHYHIWKVNANEEIMNKSFLFYHLKFNTPLWLGGTNGATMVHITKESMEKKKMLVPPKNILDKFDFAVNKINKKIDLLQQQITNLTQQRDLLLPRLMSGKLEVE